MQPTATTRRETASAIPAALTRLLLFILGGCLYGAIEILWRGYTHFSMVITGGICFLMLLRINRTNLNFITKCVVGGLAITAVEFTVGCIVNLWWGMSVWDYSSVPLNLLGQACPQFTLAWCILSGVVFFCTWLCARARILISGDAGVRRNGVRSLLKKLRKTFYNGI